MPSFYPEMNEPEPTGVVDGKEIILKSSYNYGDSYSLRWTAENNDKVRALLKANNVRPKKNGRTDDGTTFTPAKDTVSGKAGYWSCLVTSKSMDKLRPYSAHSVLLD